MTDDDRTVAPIPDPDGTIITPGAPAPPAGEVTLPAFAPRRAVPPQSRNESIEITESGLNPLVSAANPLLNVVHVLRTTPAQSAPLSLHARLLDAIETFEQHASAKGIARHKVIAARFVLCTLLDEAIAGTPWGSAAPRLLEQLHSEQRGGERVFELLARLGEDPRGNAELLELFQVCLGLGLEGRYRDQPNGRNQLDAIRQRVFELVSTARRDTTETPNPRALAAHWQGMSLPPRPIVAMLPLWAVVALGLASILIAFAFVNRQLNASAAPLFKQIHSIPAQIGPPPSPEPRAQVPRLRPMLADAAPSGMIDVREDALRSIVTLATDAAFLPGTAQLEALAKPAITRVAAALRERSGQILVVGHTDDTPINTVRFPSNWHLSRERAAAVAKALEAAGLPGARVRIEGRGDIEPIASNDAHDGRARNRRVEIQLVLPRPDR